MNTDIDNKQISESRKKNTSRNQSYIQIASDPCEVPFGESI